MRPGVFRYTPRSFLRAERAGVFGDRKVEMIEGVPYVMGTNPPHVYTVLRLAKLLRNLFPDDRWTVAEEKMIELATSCPIPDLLILSGPMEDYQARKIQAGDIHLLVEVADSSWAKDRGKKLAAYAKVGIPECWLVRLRNRCVYRFAEPVGEEYGRQDVFEEGDRIPGADTTLRVADFLPRPARGLNGP